MILRIASPIPPRLDTSGSNIGNHKGEVFVNALRSYVKLSRTQAERYPALRKPVPNVRCAFLAVHRKFS